MDAAPSDVITLLKKARAKGIGIIGMKIFGKSQLVARRDECVHRHLHLRPSRTQAT